MKEQVEEEALAQDPDGRACRSFRDIQTGGWRRSVRWASAVDSCWYPWPRLAKAMDLEKGVFRRTAPAYLELFQHCKCQHKYTETAAQSEQP